MHPHGKALQAQHRARTFPKLAKDVAQGYDLLQAFCLCMPGAVSAQKVVDFHRCFLVLIYT